MFKGRLELRPDLYKICNSPPTEIGDDESLWGQKWNEVLWGPQRILDLAEAATYKTAKASAAATGKGVRKGKNKGHWTSPLIHNSFGEPLPFELDVVRSNLSPLADEYCIKAGAADKKVNDPKACTYQGCPVAAASAADHNASPEGFDPSATLDEIQNREPKQAPVAPKQKGKVAAAKKPGKGA